MKELMTIYRTRSWGGMEGRDIIERDFITEENARDFAKANDWDSGFTLYKVEYTVDEKTGYIDQTETKMGDIEGGRGYKR